MLFFNHVSAYRFKISSRFMWACYRSMIRNRMDLFFFKIIEGPDLWLFMASPGRDELNR